MSRADQPLMLTYDQSSGNGVNDGIDVPGYIDYLIQNMKFILGLTAAALLIGTAYALIANPVYETNLLFHVEDERAAKSVMERAPDVNGNKPATETEMEILRSKLVLSRAIESTSANIKVEPVYFPLIGEWIAKRRSGLSNPGLFGYGNYVWGGEELKVKTFTVPESMEGEKFTVTVVNGGEYQLVNQKLGIDITGKVGEIVSTGASDGAIELQIEKLAGKDGAQFTIEHTPMISAVKELQKKLDIKEQGRQSNIVNVSLQGSDPLFITRLLNEIGRTYTQQHVERKVEETQQSLAYLNKQIPELKAQLDRSESDYNQLRYIRNTVDLAEESKNTLQKSATNQLKLEELQQKREALSIRYMPAHPLVKEVDVQIRLLKTEMEATKEKLKSLPALEQELLKHTRDVKVNTEVYTSLLATAQNLRLVKESQLGNVRLLDKASKPVEPVKPKRMQIVLLSALCGLLMGIIAMLVKKFFSTGVEDPQMIEDRLRLPVKIIIPHSAAQERISHSTRYDNRSVSVLADSAPSENAIDSLRSLRTALQFDMDYPDSKVIMITGPTPSVGKSFVAANLSKVLASNGKRVLLIDADLRKGLLHRHFNVSRKMGLSEFIDGMITKNSAIHANVMDGVDFMATGELPRVPGETLSHANFPAMLKRLEMEYDHIIIDTSPVLVASDAIIVSAYVGAVFNVVRSKVTTLGEIEESVKRLLNAKSPYKGLIFNDLVLRSSKYLLSGSRYRHVEYEY